MTTHFSGPMSIGGSMLLGKVQSIIASATMDRDANGGSVIAMNAAAGLQATLPPAVGSGDVYRFTVGTALSSNDYIIQCDSQDDGFYGMLVATTDTAGEAKSWSSSRTGADDTITLNGTTSGGRVGDYIEVVDVADGVWMVTGWVEQSGTEVTPFSEELGT